MSKTKELIIMCGEVSIASRGSYSVRIVLSDPDMEFLSSIKKEDIFTHIQSEGYKPAAVFDEEELNEWALSHGFIKE